MDASVVIGQQNFTSNTANDGQGSINKYGLSWPFGVYSDGTRLFVSDNVNNRVLIYNHIPISNHASADVVIGQQDFTHGDINQGGSAEANTLRVPAGILTIGNKLLISDVNNRRVLVYNNIPTSNNASADVVIGQPDMSTTTAGTTATKIDNYWGGNVAYDPSSGKLAISDYINNRILIYNALPTSNGAAADVVVGQADFTSKVSACSQTGFNSPMTITIADGKLIAVADTQNRVLIWNTIPTTNNAPADVVIGQQDFTHCSANQGGSISAKGFNKANGVAYDDKRLFISDTNNYRILIFKGIPTANGASAYQVLGQPNFTSRSTNQGHGPTENTVNYPMGQSWALTDKFIFADNSNNRVLIFNNITKEPALSLNNISENRPNSLVRLYGRADQSVQNEPTFNVIGVDYSINNSGWQAATSLQTDGGFSRSIEEFYFDFDPKANNNILDGFTAKVRAQNTNLDYNESLLYFQPFTVNDPPNNSFSASDTPSFDFSVNKQRQVLKDNLAKYQIQIKRPGDTSPWEVYLDDIPIDFSTVQTSEDNKQRNDYVNKPADNSNGTYETDKLTVFYSEDSSRIKVWGKTGLEDSFPNFSSGAIQWRVAAMDIVQHHQESPSRTLRLNTLKTTINYPFFPLSVLNISGLGNPNLSTENQAAAKISYTLSSTNPVFYGIAFANAKITMALTDQDCDQSKQDDCTQIFTTTANPESRFGINLPLNSLKWGKTYTTTLGVNLGQDYNELPEFTLSLNQPATSGQ